MPSALSKQLAAIKPAKVKRIIAVATLVNDKDKYNSMKGLSKKARLLIRRGKFEAVNKLAQKNRAKYK